MVGNTVALTGYGQNATGNSLKKPASITGSSRSIPGNLITNFLDGGHFDVLMNMDQSQRLHQAV